LDRWLETRPDDPAALVLKGQLHLDYEHARYAAIDSYRRAVQLDPENEEAHLGLALACLEAKSYPEAAQHLEYLHRCQPDNLRVQVGLAQCRDATGDRAEAVRMLDRVLAVRPDHAPALAQRGRIALESGQHADAEDWLRQAVTLDPSDHQSRHHLMLCLYHNGKEAEAKEHDQRLKQREADLQRFDEIVNVELRERPNDAALHCELGQLLLRTGRREEGVRWLRSALRQDAKYAPAQKALAELKP
jgi:predicted Zn-dependent protease